jgi:hypothetical protein
MKVKELIAELLKLDPETAIYADDEEYGPYEIEDVAYRVVNKNGVSYNDETERKGWVVSQ